MLIISDKNTDTLEKWKEKKNKPNKIWSKKLCTAKHQKNRIEEANSNI